MPRKITKEKKKFIEESKSVALPLNPEEEALIGRYRENKQNGGIFFKIDAKITPEATTYEMNPACERGSNSQKSELMLAQLCEIFGTKNEDVADRLFSSCVNATGLMHGFKPNDVARNMNTVLAMISSLKPQDEIESMIIGRLIALNFQSMSYLGSSSNKDISTQVREMHINRSTKLFRLYNETLEALMRYRRKGTQQVIVQHVNVENGGQAIVGSVQTGSGVNNKI